MKTFGTLISEARRAKGLSQKDLALKVKIGWSGRRFRLTSAAAEFHSVYHCIGHPVGHILVVNG